MINVKIIVWPFGYSSVDYAITDMIVVMMLVLVLAYVTYKY